LPPAMAVVPEYELSPPSVSVPLPVFISPSPLIRPEIDKSEAVFTVTVPLKHKSAVIVAVEFAVIAPVKVIWVELLPASV